MSLVGSHQAKVTVNNGSTVTRPTLTSGLACTRGVFITLLKTAQQTQSQVIITPAKQMNTIIPKLLIKDVCKFNAG